MNESFRRIPRPNIPPGDYHVEFVRHWLQGAGEHLAATGKNSLKLYVIFEILEGEFAGLQIARCYNVVPAPGKRRWGGSRSHDIWVEFCAVMDGILDTTSIRLDEIPISRLKGLRIIARVRQVQKNRKDVPLLGGAAYSVIDALLGRVSTSVSEYFSFESNFPLAKPIPEVALAVAPAENRQAIGIQTVSQDSLGKSCTQEET